MTTPRLPRLLIAGLAGDVGKSLVSLGLIGAARRRGLVVAAFKKGPDFIDAAWLGIAAGTPGRNLDTFMMEPEVIRSSMANRAPLSDLAIIEGNRGLFDGLGPGGEHSSAQLAHIVGAPVVLVVDATKATRTLAAQVLGCQAMDPELELAGVILNRVGTARQERVIREAIQLTTGLPVLGVLPRLALEHLPSRHLGLVTAGEHPRATETLAELASIAEQCLDMDALIELAGRATETLTPHTACVPPAPTPVRIGLFKDRAFSFYYPENLEALELAGAELIGVSPLDDAELPEVDALYVGGGFPEVYAEELSANQSLRSNVRRKIDAGMPVWAECGGLMYLSDALVVEGRSYPMVGSLPVRVEQHRRPQGHGYVRARVDSENPFLSAGTELRGHEFHYSSLTAREDTTATVLELQRGVGLGAGRDGLFVERQVASYTHVHALGTPAWAPGLVAAARGDAR